MGSGYVGPNCGSARNALLISLAKLTVHTQLTPFAKMAHGLLLAIPKARPFVSFSEQDAHTIFALAGGRRSWNSMNVTTM